MSKKKEDLKPITFRERVNAFFENNPQVDSIVLSTIPISDDQGEVSVVKGLAHFSPYKGGDGNMQRIDLECASIDDLARFLLAENPKLISGVPFFKYDLFVSSRIHLSLSKTFYDILHEGIIRIKEKGGDIECIIKKT